jgi:hypothetical protein
MAKQLILWVVAATPRLPIALRHGKMEGVFEGVSIVRFESCLLGFWQGLGGKQFGLPLSPALPRVGFKSILSQ